MSAKKRYLHSFYKDALHTFHQKFKRLPGKLQPEDTHRLRIALKNLWADYFLLEVLSSNKFDAKRHYAKHKRLFNKAGKVREIQINSLIVPKAGLPAEILNLYLGFNSRKREKYERSFISYLHNFPKKASKAANIKNAGLNKKMSKKEFLHRTGMVIKNKSGEIRRLNAKGNKVANIHQIRKDLKIIYRAVSLYPDIKLAHGLEGKTKEVKQIEQQLGKWHDGAVLERSMNKFLLKSDNHEVTGGKSVKKLLGQLDRKNSLLLKNAQDRIDRLFAGSKNFSLRF